MYGNFKNGTHQFGNLGSQTTQPSVSERLARKLISRGVDRVMDRDIIAYRATLSRENPAPPTLALPPNAPWYWGRMRLVGDSLRRNDLEKAIGAAVQLDDFGIKNQSVSNVLNNISLLQTFQYKVNSGPPTVGEGRRGYEGAVCDAAAKQNVNNLVNNQINILKEQAGRSLAKRIAADAAAADAAAKAKADADAAAKAKADADAAKVKADAIARAMAECTQKANCKWVNDNCVCTAAPPPPPPLAIEQQQEIMRAIKGCKYQKPKPMPANWQAAAKVYMSAYKDIPGWAENLAKRRSGLFKSTEEAALWHYRCYGKNEGRAGQGLDGYTQRPGNLSGISTMWNQRD